MRVSSRLLGPLAVSRLLGGLAVVLTVVSAGILLFPRPLADVFFAGWVLCAVVIAVFGAVGAWMRRTALVWVAAVLLTGLAVVGMWSIGPFIAPAAVALLGAALVSLLTDHQPDVKGTSRPDPLSALEPTLKTLCSFVATVLGVGLVYEGLVVRRLFTRGCARESVDCVLAVARWDGVGLLLLGLTAVGISGWVVWRQVTLGLVPVSSGHE